MTHSFCGLDFGTSNSTLGIVQQTQAKLVPLEPSGASAMRSAIFLNEHDRKIHYGKAAVEDYLQHEEGRLLMAIKSVLGSTLMHEQTRVFNQMRPFTEILGYFVKHLKTTAEHFAGHELDSVLLGRPVHFDDDDPTADQRAEDTLAEIARAQGFKHVAFQYEPVAAATAFRQSNPDGSLALIVDMGGGTSDFTILRIGTQASQNSDDILASAGVHIGGTDIDRLLALRKVMPLLGMGGSIRTFNGKILPLPSSVYHDLSTWHKINPLYSVKAMHTMQDWLRDAVDKQQTGRLLTVLENRDGHRVLEHCEAGKIQLAQQQETQIDLDFIESELAAPLSQTELAELIQNETQRILNTITDMQQSCGVTSEQIDVIFFTGGTSRLLHIQNSIRQHFPTAKMVNGDVFGAVGMGLTYEAQQRFA